MEILLSILLILSTLFVVCVKLRYELQMFQQNSYRTSRYFKWFKKNFGEKFRILELVGYLLILLVINKIFFFLPIVIFFITSISLLKRKSKVKLNFTARAKRIYFTTLGLYLVISTLVYIFTKKIELAFACLICFEVLSFVMINLANFILNPVEKSINNWYINDAKRILKENPNLLIIGITGSYGKTSTKHFLETILSQKFNVLMTPGSFNTTMGVVRTIREYLNPTHQIFICEMGAKQINDIKEICDIVHPKIAIISSVAEQHLDTFKCIENVLKTKYELVDSLPKDGFAILNGDYQIMKNRKVENDKVYFSLEDSSNEYFADNISYSQLGTNFTVHSKNGKFDYQTPLLGYYNISNILSAIACAEYLGMDYSQISFGVHKLKAVEHRMEIKTMPNGVCVIDDAFNSNPKGAKMALDILKTFENQRIVITPGIIELADKQEFYNTQLGEQIAQSVDFAILVGKEQTLPIYNGLKNQNFPEEKIYIAKDLNDAATVAYSRAKVGDTILFENDLPDLFKK